MTTNPIKYIFMGLLLLSYYGTAYGSQADDPNITNFEYNTIFAEPPYSEAKFKNIKIGSNKGEILASLGQPLYVKEIRFLHCILFSKGDYRIDPGSAEFHGIDASEVRNDSVPFLALWFSESGQVNHVFNRNYIQKDSEGSLLGLDRRKIIEKFEKAKDEIKIQPCYFYSYSRLKEGPFTGHDGGIFLRRVYFNTDDKVIFIESGEGSSYDIYSGITKNWK